MFHPIKNLNEDEKRYVENVDSDAGDHSDGHRHYLGRDFVHVGIVC